MKHGFDKVCRVVEWCTLHSKTQKHAPPNLKPDNPTIYNPFYNPTIPKAQKPESCKPSSPGIQPTMKTIVRSTVLPVLRDVCGVSFICLHLFFCLVLGKPRHSVSRRPAPMEPRLACPSCESVKPESLSCRFPAWVINPKPLNP